MDQQKSFVKFMVGDFTRHLKVPKKFMNHFKSSIPRLVMLRCPSGSVWPVMLREVAGDLFLKSGWKNFVKDHHIQKDDLLVFNCKADSGVDVLIFGPKGCGKVSAFATENRRHETPGRRRKKDSTGETQRLSQCSDSSKSSSSIEVSLDLGGCKSPKTFFTVKIKHQGWDTSQYRTPPASNPKRSLGGMSKSRAKRPESEIEDIHEEKLLDNICCYSSKRLRLSHAQMRELSELALAVKSGNPYFVAVMKASCVGSPAFLTIPKPFAEAHLPSESQSIILQVAGRRKRWTVSYLVLKTAKIWRGKWRNFALDNDLQEGDVCIFELIKNTGPITFVVHISNGE